MLDLRYLKDIFKLTFTWSLAPAIDCVFNNNEVNMAEYATIEAVNARMKGVGTASTREEAIKVGTENWQKMSDDVKALFELVKPGDDKSNSGDKGGDKGFRAEHKVIKDNVKPVYELLKAAGVDVSKDTVAGNNGLVKELVGGQLKDFVFKYNNILKVLDTIEDNDKVNLIQLFGADASSQTTFDASKIQAADFNPYKLAEKLVSSSSSLGDLFKAKLVGSAADVGMFVKDDKTALTDSSKIGDATFYITGGASGSWTTVKANSLYQTISKLGLKQVGGTPADISGSSIINEIAAAAGSKVGSNTFPDVLKAATGFKDLQDFNSKALLKSQVEFFISQFQDNGSNLKALLSDGTNGNDNVDNALVALKAGKGVKVDSSDKTKLASDTNVDLDGLVSSKSGWNNDVLKFINAEFVTTTTTTVGTASMFSIKLDKKVGQKITAVPTDVHMQKAYKDLHASVCNNKQEKIDDLVTSQDKCSAQLNDFLAYVLIYQGGAGSACGGAKDLAACAQKVGEVAPLNVAYLHDAADSIFDAHSDLKISADQHEDL